MKKLVAFALILSLGLITLGCTPTDKPKKPDDKKPGAGAPDKPGEKAPDTTKPAAK
jgi:hypothetical protein